VWSGEVGDQEDVDEVLDPGALLFLWAVGCGVCVDLLGDVLLQGDHGHLDGLYVGEVQEARMAVVRMGGWPLVRATSTGTARSVVRRLRRSRCSGRLGMLLLGRVRGARYIEVEVVWRSIACAAMSLVVAVCSSSASCKVDILGCSCSHAESQLKRECSLEHPAFWLRDGEPGEEALEGDALA